MNARQDLIRLWQRSIFDTADCCTVEEYAARVAERLLTAYGEEVEPTVDAVHAALVRLDIMKGTER